MADSYYTTNLLNYSITVDNFVKNVKNIHYDTDGLVSNHTVKDLSGLRTV